MVPPQLNTSSKTPEWVQGRKPVTPRQLLKDLSFNFTDNEPRFEERGGADNPYKVYIAEVQTKDGKIHMIELFKNHLDEAIRLAQLGKRFEVVVALNPSTKKDQTVIIEAE